MISQQRNFTSFFHGKEKVSSMASKCADVGSLRPEGYAAAKKGKKKCKEELVDGDGYSVADKNWGQYLLWFIVVTLVVWIILYVLKPLFLQSRDPTTGLPTGQVDTGKALAVSVIIAIIIIIILWLVKRR